MDKKNYIGLTIGPLYRTLTSVKQTRELWGASYIFSYIMKKMVEKLKNGKKFVIPYTGDDQIFQAGKEVGLFHDRFIFEAGTDDFDKVIKVKNEVLNEIAKKINKEDNDNVFNFLDKYFQIYFCEMEIEGDYKAANNEINQYLDSLELQSKFIKKEGQKNKQGQNPLFELFDRVNSSFLVEDAFGEKKRHSFLSIPEIAALKQKYDKNKDKCELNWEGITPSPKKKDSENEKNNSKSEYDVDDSNIYEQLIKNNPNTFKQYHKYIAIVQADGDNLTSTINELNSNADFGKLSKALLDFSLEAHKAVSDYGGLTIFAGGDDILFFAPVISGEQSVFDLVDNLGKIFKDKFEKFENPPTLSAGISITYYKYPMGEALENAADLLFNKAKNFEGKNAVAFEVEKHSGQNFSGVFNKSSGEYKTFQKLIKCNSKEEMLTSLIHKLNLHKAVVELIGKDETSLKNYFTNFFNESEHDKFKELIDLTAEFVNKIHLSVRKTEKPEEEIMEKTKLIDSVLRLKKFMGGER
ncbi:MAG: type III-B CRISPR-associated protein Cas10/Cmr2 [Desulfamplus sp.]|nr:type III-B CRISPR-associated protein Cas10/Cmr2 [Desulfamplus sp.]